MVKTLSLLFSLLHLVREKNPRSYAAKKKKKKNCIHIYMCVCVCVYLFYLKNEI